MRLQQSSVPTGPSTTPSKCWVWYLAWGLICAFLWAASVSAHRWRESVFIWETFQECAPMMQLPVACAERLLASSSSVWVTVAKSESHISKCSAVCDCSRWGQLLNVTCVFLPAVKPHTCGNGPVSPPLTQTLCLFSLYQTWTLHPSIHPSTLLLMDRYGEVVL